MTGVQTCALPISITTTHAVENYPPIKSISGLELGNKFLEHAKAYEDRKSVV